jgi:hypothetical protein
MYTPLTNQQAYDAQGSANADTQMALNQARTGALAGQFDSNGDRGAQQGSNVTTIASPEFSNTLNAVDPTGQGNLNTDLQETSAIVDPESTIDKIMQGVSLAASVGALTAGAGGMLGAGAGFGLGLSAPVATVGSGVVGGAAEGLLTNGTSGGAIGKDALTGGLTAGIAQGVAPLTGALGDTIYNADPGFVSSDTADALAGGLTKGAVGAGIGALTGGSNGALVGGIGGATAGAVTGETGMAPLGQVSGTIAGGLANKYLTSPAAPAAAPAAPAATTPAVAPAAANTQQVLPTLPGTSGPQAMASTTQGPTGNIGAYSGFNDTGSTAGLGYAPRQEANMSGTNWATYGEGPEQQFFQPASGG